MSLKIVLILFLFLIIVNCDQLKDYESRVVSARLLVDRMTSSMAHVKQKQDFDLFECQ